MNEFIVKDKGWNRVRALLSEYNVGAGAKVGIQGPKGKETHEDGVTNIMLAIVHEFGYPEGNIPERSFIRATFDANEKEYQEEINRIGKDVYGDKPVRAAMRMLGEKFRQHIIATIEAGIPPPLADATAERRLKGGQDNTPLWDTGQLVASISVVVTKVKAQ